MHVLKSFRGLTIASLTLGLAVTSFNVAGLLSIDKANAQSKSHGVILNRGSLNRGAKPNRPRVTPQVNRRGSVDPLIRSVNNPLYVRREVFDAVRGARSGVKLNGLRRNNNNGIRLIQREIQIQRQNEQTARRNEQRRLQASIRRSQPNGRFLTRQEQINLLNNNQVLGEDVFTNQDVGVGSAGILASECPSNHNCGYRIYENGTGPRIIRPSTNLGSDLPDYDGLNGPKVITLD